MEENSLEKLKCPICCEIPEQEIYQCRNGHSICKKCKKSVIACPICRINYESDPIRNRSLEDFLDTLKFDCEFKEQGCRRKLSRDKIAYHIDSCSLSNVMDNICKHLGYDCDVKLNVTHGNAVIEHLETAHRIPARAINPQGISITLPFSTPISTDYNCRTVLTSNNRCTGFLIHFYVHPEDVRISCAVMKITQGSVKDDRELHSVNVYTSDNKDALFPPKSKFFEGKTTLLKHIRKSLDYPCLQITPTRPVQGGRATFHCDIN